MTYTAQTNRIIHKKLKEYYIINKKFLWVNIILIILLGLIGYLIGGLYGSIFGTFTGIVIGIVLLFILPNHKKLVIEIGVPAPLNEDIKRQNPKIEI